jgi:hypothetical protein
MPKKNGRPVGGKNPPVIREYWRNMQKIHRELKKQEAKMERKRK